MSFLLDTEICSAYLKGNNAVATRFTQYGGRLHLSAVSLGEIFAWALRAKASPSRMKNMLEMLRLVDLIEVNSDVARRFGETKAILLDQGLSAPDLDLLNAATALVHDLIVVTHNTADYTNIPGLTVVDWLAP
jgi:predicted nucleic acid-binding protein